MMLDRVQLLMLMAALALLSGCANNVVVKADIPSPLVEKLPITGAMVYNDRFKNYVYLEAEKNRRFVKKPRFGHGTNHNVRPGLRCVNDLGQP